MTTAAFGQRLQRVFGPVVALHQRACPRPPFFPACDAFSLATKQGTHQGGYDRTQDTEAEAFELISPLIATFLFL